MAPRVDTRIWMEVPSDLDSIEETVNRIVDYCLECPDNSHGRILLNFRVGLMEALANAMLYGNGRDPGKRVRLEITARECSITACITDEGPGFNPEAVPDPTRPSHLEREGGRGLFLMRKLMDEVHYNERGNRVTMILRLQEFSGEQEEARA